MCTSVAAMHRLLVLVVLLVVCAASTRRHHDDGALTIEREKLVHFYEEYATEYARSRKRPTVS